MKWSVQKFEECNCHVCFDVDISMLWCYPLNRKKKTKEKTIKKIKYNDSLVFLFGTSSVKK